MDKNIHPSNRLYGYMLQEYEMGAVAFQRRETFPLIESPVELAELLRASPSNYVIMREEFYDRLLASGLLPPDTTTIRRDGQPLVLVSCKGDRE